MCVALHEVLGRDECVMGDPTVPVGVSVRSQGALLKGRASCLRGRTWTSSISVGAKEPCPSKGLMPDHPVDLFLRLLYRLLLP